jgi:hypothetical protein
MSINNIYSQLVIVAGVIAILIIASKPGAFAKTVQVNGSGQGTDLTTAFKFHEGALRTRLFLLARTTLAEHSMSAGCRRIFLYRRQLHRARWNRGHRIFSRAGAIE